jgi:methylenetetrahydrofolate dehydrogenase (NADP+)/methenyltetrahydrofolate cyclohydrolase
MEDRGMSARIIDGKAFAAGVRARVTTEVARLGEAGVRPGLAVVLVGEDPASAVYVRNKGLACAEAGIASFEHRLPATTTEVELLALIAQLNADPQVHGILCQLPLPAQIDTAAVLAAIAPAKDVDGFHVSNAGLLAVGQRALVPCTPLGCLMLLRDLHGDLAGMEAVVLGRSNIVGKPMAQLLLRDSCTVTVAHSRTRDLPGVVRRADIVVAAVGRPRMVGPDWIKPGATVIDVGINRVQDGLREDGSPRTRLVGDVDFEGCAAVAGAITPVPGGVGPMTIACLLANTITACCRALGLPEPEGLTA